jgi:hypothetical protein
VEAAKALPSSNTKLHQAGLSLAPNPTSGEVAIRFGELEEAAEISLEIHNALGQLVLYKDFGKAAQLDEKLDLGRLNSGLYFVSVKAGGERFEQKLIISKD